jgi:sRNA-binding carbon storage regulator CsrA
MFCLQRRIGQAVILKRHGEDVGGLYVRAIGRRPKDGRAYAVLDFVDFKDDPDNEDPSKRTANSVTGLERCATFWAEFQLVGMGSRLPVQVVRITATEVTLGFDVPKEDLRILREEIRSEPRWVRAYAEPKQEQTEVAA